MAAVNDSKYLNPVVMRSVFLCIFAFRASLISGLGDGGGIDTGWGSGKDSAAAASVPLVFNPESVVDVHPRNGIYPVHDEIFRGSDLNTGKLRGE